MQYIHFLNEDLRNILYAFIEWNCYLLFANLVLQNFIWHGFQITNNSNICALLLYATSIWSAPRSSFNTVEKLRIHGLNYFIAVGKQAEGQTCVSHRADKIRRYKFYDLSFGGFDFITVNTLDTCLGIYHTCCIFLRIIFQIN